MKESILWCFNAPDQRKHLEKEGIIKNKFSFFSTKAYVVGIQKNHLNETVLLTTQLVDK